MNPKQTPEQTFFEDPALDLKKLGEEPAGDERAAQREAFVRNLMQQLLGEQQSKGLP